MLRLFIVSLFVMTALHFASAGMQESYGQTALSAVEKARDAGTIFAEKHTEALGQHIEPRCSASGTQACDAGQNGANCDSCQICQVCHEAGMVANASPAMLTAATAKSLATPHAGSVSADDAPSLKPPIA